MIWIEVDKGDLMAQKVEVKNLPGVLFGGCSPLIRPFMKKLEDLLPPEKHGQGDSYILRELSSCVDFLQADENSIRIQGGNKAVEITRSDLQSLMGERYPESDHHRLNLPGLLFLQSSPGLIQASLSKLRQEHGLNIPEGRRTQRYIFHATVVSLEANKDRVRIGLELERLPRRADGSSPI
jgi:hypothetical protein